MGVSALQGLSLAPSWEGRGRPEQLQQGCVREAHRRPDLPLRQSHWSPLSGWLPWPAVWFNVGAEKEIWDAMRIKQSKDPLDSVTWSVRPHTSKQSQAPTFFF